MSTASGWRRKAPWLRLAVAIAFGLLLARSGDLLSEIWANLRSADAGLFGVGLFLYLVGLFAGALRLAVLLRAANLSRSLSLLYGDVLQGTALNASLVMGSGEMWRVHRMAPDVPPLALRSAFVVVDRLLGVATLAAVGLIAWLAFGRGDSPWLRPSATSISLVVVGISLALWMASTQRHRIRVDVRWRRDFGLWLGIATASLCSALLWIVSVICFAKSLGIGDAELGIVYSAPIAAIASLLPVTVGGLGIREGAYVILLGPWEVAASQAIALGLLQYAGFLAGALVGGAALLLSGDRRGEAEAQ